MRMLLAQINYDYLFIYKIFCPFGTTKVKQLYTAVPKSKVKLYVQRRTPVA